LIAPGHFAGFYAGSLNAHHLQNKFKKPACVLVIGSRRPGQETIQDPDDQIGPI
jgi:uncharacterized cupin superfamily protein